MTTKSLAMIAAIVLAPLPSCGPPQVSDAGDLLADDQSEQPGCELFVRKCSRCHEIERIAVYRAATPEHWDRLVGRMRRQRGSNINEREGRSITQCLVKRQFGRQGLEALWGPKDGDQGAGNRDESPSGPEATNEATNDVTNEATNDDEDDKDDDNDD